MHSTKAAAPWWRPAVWARPWAVPGAARRRLTLVALAVLLQTVLEAPRQAIVAAIGPAPTALLIMASLAGSLALLVAAIVTEDQPEKPQHARLAIAALVLCVAVGVVGARQVGAMLVASVTHTTYFNDGTTIDHYAAQLLIEGHDPYQSMSIVAALRFLNEPGQYVTPLRRGAFAGRSWLDYPSAAEVAAAVNSAPATPASAAPEVESHVSYPALSFLWLVPFVWAGLPSVILFSVLSLAAFGWLAIGSVAAEWRPWLALLLVADIPLLNATLTGSLDVTTMALVFAAWLWWRRGPAATIALGLALATKQQAWFFALFYAIFLLRQIGWRATLTRMAGAVAIFAAIDAPFILHDPHAWAAGVLAPLADPMYPRGNGLVQLALSGLAPLMPQAVYSALAVLAFVAALAWYARVGVRRWPELGIALAMLPFWFEWRSLSSYFLFIALPLVALWLAWRFPAALARSEPALAPAGGA